MNHKEHEGHEVESETLWSAFWLLPQAALSPCGEKSWLERTLFTDAVHAELVEA